MSPSNPRARHHVLGIVALSLFAALFTRLWYLQVLTTDEYEVAARDNRTREVILEAPRGRILDRNGTPLVQNRRVIQVTISYQAFIDLDAPEQSEVLRRLANELNRDALLIHDGQRVANDPGAVAEPVESTDEGTATGDEIDDEGAVGDEGEVVEGEGVEGEGDPSGAVGEGETDEEEAVDPRTQPPAGVATGARNPDGEREVDVQPPVAVTEETLRERLEDPRFSKFKPVPVATGISEQLEVAIREDADQYPTVAVERVTAREYRYGALLAHALGYVGAITEDELDEFQNTEKPYENDDQIGKTGIERGYELELRGTPGRVVYEVDARNRPVRELEDLRSEPVPGRDVYLTVDINMQYVMEKGLAAEVARRQDKQDAGCFLPGGCDPPGAASIAIDPRNGQVLAMASYPTYDPNLFIGGISRRDYEAITDEDRVDEHHDPLLNRAIAGQYAPGSTFKLFSAYAGLDHDVITPDFVYNDTGKYAYSAECDLSLSPDETNCYAQNAGAAPNGAVNLEQALSVSSDTYFYRIGDVSWRRRGDIGDEAMQESMKRWGLGTTTGIDLPSEAPGRIPTPDWLLAFSAEINEGDPEAIEANGRWSAGTSGNMMVGQGDVLATPLQLANGYAALANGGTLWLPQLVLQTTDYSSDSNVRLMERQAIGQVELPPEWREPMLRGFDDVTKGGTASTAFSGFDQGPCAVSGKTGTAQVNDKNDTSLFTAYAPTPFDGRESTIAMATVFQEAGFGAAAAVPLTRRVLEPFAAAGCDIERFAESAPDAPLGGWFDVEAAQEEFVPPVAVSSN